MWLWVASIFDRAAYSQLEQPALSQIDHSTTMLSDFLQEQAALYAAGQMHADERDQFDVLLEFHHELRAFTGGLSDVGATLVRASLRSPLAQPPAGLRAQLLQRLERRPQSVNREGLVVSGPDRLVEWVSPAFSQMCGYSLDELRGKSLGPILQGEATDRAVAERMRQAVRESRPCREKILNYRKSGETYWVEIDIQPYRDEAGQPLWFIAREWELSEPQAA
jgi:PAS domain S-box-containing protein